MASEWAAIQRSYVDSKKINAVSIDAEMLFIRLLMVVDSAGRYFGHAYDIGARVLTIRMRNGELSTDLVEGLLQELEQAGLIARGEVDGELLMQVLAHKDQRRSQPKFAAIPGVMTAGTEEDDGAKAPSVPTGGRKRHQPSPRGDLDKKEMEKEIRSDAPSACPVWFPDERWALCCSQVAANLDATSVSVMKAVSTAARTELVEWSVAKEVAGLAEAQSEVTRGRFLEWIDKGDTAAGVAAHLNGVLAKAAGKPKATRVNFVGTVLSNWRRDLGHAS